jgi:ATP-binding cassette subfamily C protein LapB
VPDATLKNSGGQPVPQPQARPLAAPAAVPGTQPPPQAPRKTELALAELGDSNPQNTTVPDPSDVNFTPPLIDCMAALFRLHGRPVSTNLLIAHLPAGDGTMHPAACIRAARAAGMNASTVHRPSLDGISPLTLPCILLLRSDRCCVLTRLEDLKAEVIFPESGQTPITVERKGLQDEYLGYAIFGKPQEKLDKRASEIKLLKAKRWFWDTLLYYLPIYRHVVGASIVVNMLALCGPLFFMNVYDRVVPNQATDTLWVLAAGIGIAYIFDFLLRNLRSYFVDAAGKNADVILASRLMNHLLGLRLDAKPDSTGSLANNLREFESLRDFFGSTTLLALVDLPFLFIFIVIIGLIGGPMVAIPLIAVPIIVGVGLLLQLPMQRTAEKGFKENMQKNALLVEIINGLETIKTSMAEGKVQHTWEQVVGQSAVSNCHSKRMSSLSVTVTLLATQMVSVGIIIWGVYRIPEFLTMGGLIACNMLAGRAMAPLSQVSGMLARLQQSRMALKSLDTLMNMPVERPEDSDYVEFGRLEHSLTFEGVTFKYPNSERLALDGVNIYIRPGEKVGIIGRMGSGKSTFGRFCLGLYQPADGAVKMGGVDIRQMDPTDLRSRIGYVSQDNYLFYGTVRENIAFGSMISDDRMILRAAHIAGVTDFVRAHPAGFGMPVGERGMALSGGQRQSVAIARALLQDPDILVLDEPTSNMDNSSEYMFRQRLGASLGSKTLILITHRLSMLDIVDRLVVMDAGRIMADGPKNAVLSALRGEQAKPRKAVAAPAPQTGGLPADVM